jgi:NodT family efflux transporter outer membrane factor (OMF) lipoprotein
MNKIRNIFAAAAVSTMLTGCGIYNKYEKTVEDPTNVFGTNSTFGTPAEVLGDTTSIAQMSWREFFTDPLLQDLIEQALANNTDLNTARINIEKSAASLRAAKLAYLPSFFLSPQGAIYSFDRSKASKTYSLQMDMAWDVDLFGSITNKKRAAKAVLLQSQMSEESTRSNLISSVAQEYFYLQLLDRQLDILIQTDSLWHASLEMEKALYENGQVYSTAVNQQESSWLDVKTQIVDTRLFIQETEDEICSLLCITPQHINRSKWHAVAEYHTGTEGLHLFDPAFLRTGVPARMLEQRPDIRLYNFYMEEAFYNTQKARSAFFPSLTLTGTAGWANNGGAVVTNPGALLLKAVASLSQPIFARGQLKADLKTAQLTEENLKKKYVQTVIDAGMAVNKAMAHCQAAREKHQYYQRQVQVLHDAFIDTHYLMESGDATYLEVITAQESFLAAQLSEASNIYDGAQAIIALYVALGGGTKYVR